MDKKKIVKIQLIVFIILFFVIIGFFIYRENDTVFSILAAQSKKPIYSNYETGFYSEDLKIYLTKDTLLPFNAKIYYTTDGEDPNKYSKEYNGEIIIECEEIEKIIPLKTVVYYKGKYSEVQEFTYIVCDNPNERYNMPIISITTNRENLYDFDKGLFVPGAIYENSVREFDEEEYYSYFEAETITKGNYHERDKEFWIRNAEIVMFDNEGKVSNESKIGLAVSGGTSSAQYPKSLKLISNYQNDLGQFEIEYLDDREKAEFSIIDYYKTIKLRSGSQSSIGANIRSTLVAELANEAGYDGCFMSKLVLVYLNGEFYGLMDMEQNYSDSFIKNKFNLEEVQKVFKVKANEEVCFKEAGLTELFNNDLTKEENQAKLEEKVDIENYLEYYAINFYINNTDWPHNNFELWYYTGEHDINNKYSDGRARFLMFDFDMSFRPESTGEWGEDQLLRVFDKNGKSGHTGFLKLMKVKKYKDWFLTIMSNMNKLAFNTDNMLNRANMIKEYLKKETDIQFQGTGWIDNLNRETTAIKNVSKEIVPRIDKDLMKEFDLSGKYEFTLNNSEGVTAKIINKTIYEKEQYKNEYFKDSQFDLIIIINPGYQINNVRINDTIIEPRRSNNNENEYVVTVDNKYIKNEKIVVNISATPKQGQILVLNEISAKDYNDWIKIYNNGTEEIYLENYYLSNNDENLLKYNLPNLKLSPKESIIIDGKKNHFAVGDYICSFSFSKHDTIYLTKYNKKDSTKEVVDKVNVPKMQITESYGRVNNSNIWNFYKNNSKRRGLK